MKRRSSSDSGLVVPDRFHHERILAAAGFQRVAGVDEAGRGPLAGPVVVGAVRLPPEWLAGGLPEILEGLNDSKQLSALRRERYFGGLMELPVGCWCIEVVPVEEIDTHNILGATHRGMARALQGLTPAPDHALVDGLRVPTLPFAQTALVKGDSLSYSIAAASILAKVTRDRILCELDREHPGYGFAIHKGYPTPSHLEALRRLGPCNAHRRSFGPVANRQGELFQS